MLIDYHKWQDDKGNTREFFVEGNTSNSYESRTDIMTEGKKVWIERSNSIGIDTHISSLDEFIAEIKTCSSGYKETAVTGVVKSTSSWDDCEYSIRFSGWVKISKYDLDKVNELRKEIPLVKEKHKEVLAARIKDAEYNLSKLKEKLANV